MPTPMVKKTVGEFNIVGYSLAGEETTIALPELNICFDAGRAPREIIPIDTLCLSHGHMDHAAGLPYYLSQRTFVGTEAGRVILHKCLVQPVIDLMECWAKIERHDSPADIVGMESGDEYTLRRNLILKAYAVNHGPDALGFSVVEHRFKLKQEFVGKTGPQLVELKKQGAEIEHKVEIPLVSYVGDTADGDFFDLDHVRNAKLLIMECTFFDPDHVVRARAGKHLHAKDMKSIFPRLRNPNILITHLTRRTDMRSAKKILASFVEEADQERITYLMDRPRRPRTGNGKKPE